MYSKAFWWHLIALVYSFLPFQKDLNYIQFQDKKMENELNKLMEESQRFQINWDDDDDNQSSLDIDEFERRIKTGESFFKEQRSVQSAKSFQGPQNLQDLNSKMKQQQLKQQQRQQQQQHQSMQLPDKKVKDLQEQITKLQSSLTKETNLRGKLEKEIKQKEVKVQKVGERMQSLDGNRVQDDWKNKTLDKPPTMTKQSSISNTKVEQLKIAFEQCKQDNELLIQKYKSLNQKKIAIEQELNEARQELDKIRKSGIQQNQSVTLPKIDTKSKRERLTEEQEAALLQEVRLLRIENEELERILTSKDQARVIKDLTLQNSKMRSKIDDLTYKNK